MLNRAKVAKGFIPISVVTTNAGLSEPVMVCLAITGAPGWPSILLAINIVSHHWCSLLAMCLIRLFTNFSIFLTSAAASDLYWGVGEF